MQVSGSDGDRALPLRRQYPPLTRELSDHARGDGAKEAHREILALFPAESAFEVAVDRIPAEASEDQERDGAGDAERRSERPERAPEDLSQNHHQVGAREDVELQTIEQPA